jgi:hypothetical protein
MKVLTLKQMLEMPEGTLFGKVPLGVYELMIKGANHPDGDFWIQSLTQGAGEFYDEALGYDAKGNELDPKNITGNSFGLNTACQERDEEFDETDLYVVYEKVNHEQLIKCLQKALETSQSQVILDPPEESAIERLAEEIYKGWSGHHGWVPWVNKGNSLKQASARELARERIEKSAIKDIK